MTDSPVFDKHFDAIQTILSPYQGNKLVNAIPGALLFVMQLHHALPIADTEARTQLLLHLDGVTDLFGKLGDIVSKGDFEALKIHYAEIQFLAAQKPVIRTMEQRDN